MKKPINKKIILIMGGVALIVLTILSLIIFNGLKTQKHYEQAVEMFQKNEYVQAVEVFDSLKKYKESALYSEKCHIAIGDLLLEQEEFEKAAEEYKKVENLTLQSEMLNKCDYAKAIKLFNEKNFPESKNIFEKLGSFEESEEYLSKCRREIKFLKFDYTGTDEAYTDFYEYYGKTDSVIDANSAESYISFLYGTWFDRNDSKFEISPTHFNGKEYGVCAVANRAVLIYFFEDETLLYELYGGHDYIAGESLECSVANDRENATIYRSITMAEYEKARKKWEEEVEKEKTNMKNKSPKEIFDFKVACERNSKGISIEQIFRNPGNYSGDTVYKFSGRIEYIQKNSNSSGGLLKIMESDTLVSFKHDGFLDFLEGDIVILYGKVLPNIETYTTTDKWGNSKTIQTFGVDVVYALNKNSFNSAMHRIEDYEWSIICGSYTADDQPHLLDKTINITKETINGVPYTITGFERSFPSDVYFQHIASEGIALEISWIDKYGAEAKALLDFRLNGEMRYTASAGSSISIYNLDLATYHKR